MILDRDERDRFVATATVDSLLFERLISAIYGQLLQPGDIAVDGGACQGLHTFPMAAAVGPTGRVYAVEALPHLAAKLSEDTVALAQVTVIPRALFSRRATLDFNFVRNDLWRSGLQRTTYPAEPDIEVLRIEAVTLDDILRDVAAWRFGKFDLEGGEYHAFQGGVQAISRLQPFLIFERSLQSPEWYGYTPADFFSLMDQVGYHVFDMFAEQMAVGEWSQWQRGWYAIGVPAGGRDEAYLRDTYPMLLRAVASGARTTF